MKIKINKKAIEATGIVLDRFSTDLLHDVETMKNNFRTLHDYFADPEYDDYLTELTKEFEAIADKCSDVNDLAKRITEYSKLFADI